MKKVNYAVGVLGLAPVAGLAMHVPAVTAAAHLAKPGKTVSLAHSVAAVPGASCTAGIPAHTSAKGLSEKFTYSKEGCVGSVTGHLAVSSSDASYFLRVRIYADHVRKFSTATRLSPVAGGGLGATAGVHQTFSRPVRVCTATLNLDASSAISYGPICKTVL